MANVYVQAIPLSCQNLQLSERKHVVFLSKNLHLFVLCTVVTSLEALGTPYFNDGLTCLALLL